MAGYGIVYRSSVTGCVVDNCFSYLRIISPLLHTPSLVSITILVFSRYLIWRSENSPGAEKYNEMRFNVTQTLHLHGSGKGKGNLCVIFMYIYIRFSLCRLK